MNENTVSLVIPVYNAVSFINQAIESVLAQTHQPLEILVIDDGSTDQTVRLLEQYEPSIRLFKQSKNSGVSAARNVGIRAARGKFIAFLDADDVFIEKEKLAGQLGVINEKDCDMVISGWQTTDENLNKISERAVWLEVPHLNLFNFIRTLPVLPSAMLVSRAKLLEINGFDESLTNAEDVDLVFRLLLAGCRTEWLPEITVAYRRHSANATNQLRSQNHGMKCVLEKLFCRPDLPVSVRQIEREIHYHSLLWAALDFFLNGDLPEMKKYLLDSREFARFSGEGLLIDWFYTFERFSTDRKKTNLDSVKLLDSNEWRELENIILAAEN